jgi:hypothetical protein
MLFTEVVYADLRPCEDPGRQRPCSRPGAGSLVVCPASLHFRCANASRVAEHSPDCTR